MSPDSITYGLRIAFRVDDIQNSLIPLYKPQDTPFIIISN
jgi:hypothetical protein